MRNTRRLIVSILFFLILTACMDQENNTKYPVTGSVERLDPRIDKIIEPGVLPEIIADSFAWSEGPVWVPEIESILFSDVPENIVYQWNEKDGLKQYLKPSGYTAGDLRPGESGSNGLLLDLDGRLLLCQHGDRRVARMDAKLDKQEPVYQTLADNWSGKKFNSPNDLCIDKEGVIYFTDPPYGLVKRWDDPKREIEFTGVYRIEPGRRDADLLIDSIQAPNGIDLSPDGKTLYVASSGPDCSLYEYKLNDEGVSSGRLFFDARELKKTRRGSCDGMYVRSDGIIFASGPGGILIFDPDGGLLGTVLTGQATSNCTIDEAGGWLYMTADMYLMRLKLK